MQEGADRSRRRPGEGRGAAAHQERRQGDQGRRPRGGRRRGRRVRRAGRQDRARWSRSTAKPTSCRATRISSRSRGKLAQLVAEQTTRPTWPRCRRCRSTASTVETRARRRWCRRSARTCRSAASCASRRHGPARAVPARRRPIGVHGRRRRRRRAAWARTSRCTSRRRGAGRDPPGCVSRDEVPADLIEKERAIFAAQAAESRQAGGHRRQDGRGPHQQVSGRGHAAGPAVRQGSGRRRSRST